MPRTNPESVRLVSPSGSSWVTVTPEKAVRLRQFGFRPVSEVADTPAAAPAKRTPRKAAE